MVQAAPSTHLSCSSSHLDFLTQINREKDSKKADDVSFPLEKVEINYGKKGSKLIDAIRWLSK
jgi:hypothetical protein